MSNVFDNERIKYLINRTFERMGLKPFPLKVLWKRNFTRRAGDARYDYARKSGVIRLSVPLCPRTTLEDRDETVVHELCHLITSHVFGRVNAHGKEWKHIMTLAGYKNPQRCHNIDRTGLKRKVTRYQFACRCSDTVWVSAVRYKKYMEGSRFKCLKCHTLVTLVSHKPRKVTSS